MVDADTLQSPCFLCSHTYHPDDLAKEEGGYVYRYSYNGQGEAAAW